MFKLKNQNLNKTHL